jgi:hypothetical protein
VFYIDASCLINCVLYCVLYFIGDLRYLHDGEKAKKKESDLEHSTEIKDNRENRTW